MLAFILARFQHIDLAARRTYVLAQVTRRCARHLFTSLRNTFVVFPAWLRILLSFPKRIGEITRGRLASVQLVVTVINKAFQSARSSFVAPHIAEYASSLILERLNSLLTC